MLAARQLLPIAGEHQDDAADETQPTEDRRQRHRLLLVRADLQRTGVDHLLAFRVGETSIRERDDAERNKNDSDDAGGLHARSWRALNAAAALEQVDHQND